ncbi:MAG: alpha/beta fold hydrolase [Firmicutes bacterium]|nr:alpha/beta fold hydrolase [Bacillota bacterium]
MPAWAVVIIVLLLLALGLRVFAEVAFRAGFTWDRDESKTEKINVDRIRRSAHPEGEAKVLAGRDWLLARESREVEITSFDGLKLRGRLYPCDRTLAGEKNRPLLLLAHGFRSYGAFDFSCGCPFYVEQGFDLLLIDQRAHGRSEGRYICFGVNEGRDVADWCRRLDREYPGRPVVLAGISMGATSVLMAAGDPDLPQNVRGVVADCGFTDCGGEFSHVLRQMYHLPARPVMALTEPLCRKRLGFGFWDHSTEKAVAQMSLPVLFFHGALDALVPADNSRRAFAACASADKELIIVEDADHGQSFLADEAGCRAKLTAFLQRLDLSAH